MFDLDRWTEIYKTIMQYKLRTALTAFGVFWGIFMLVVLLGASDGFQKGVVSGFSIKSNAVFFWTQRTTMPYKGMQPGRRIEMNNEDLAAIKQNVPEIGLIAPRNSLNGDFQVSREDKFGSFRVYGDYPDFIELQNISLSQGRFINDKDIEERRKTVIIGDEVRKALFEEEEEDPIGKYITIKGVFFKVVGLTKSKRKGENAIRDDETIYIPGTTLQQTYNQPNHIGWMVFAPVDGVSASVLEAKVKGILKDRHSVHPDDTRAFGSENVEEEFKKVSMLFMIIKSFGWFVSIFTIIAGIVGVSNIMLIIVKERTKEIGVRKALGATPWSIITMILQESLVITFFSGYFGLIAGIAAIEGINYMMVENNVESQFFANPQVELNVALAALTTLVVAGTMAGFIPARKAAKVEPVVALQQE